MDLAKLLKTVELFAGLSHEQIERLIAISQPARYNRNEYVFTQGSEGDRLYIIREGQVEVLGGPDASRLQVYLGRGQIFGEMALIDLGPRSASVRCVHDGTVLDSIQRDIFTKLCETDTSIGYLVMRNMSIDLSFKLRHHNLANY